MMSSLFSQSRSNVKLKHIESYKSRERYQADIVIISNYV